MTTQLPKDGVDRTTFPDGRPSSEYTMKKGKRHGIYRLWHENGVLAEEGRYRNGLLHGGIRKWNTKGQLLGACKMDNGTGMLREWFENGQLRHECSFVQGKLTGRMKIWAEDGMLYGQSYYFNFKPISKKAYLQKCESMPELPRFEEEKTTNTLGNYMRQLRRAKREQAKSGPTPEDLQRQKWFDESCEREAKEKNSKELLAWLAKGNKQERELGEMSKKQALQFARKLYSLGATKVWTTHIERDEDGAGYSKELIIALPKTSTNQSKIYELCTGQARPSLGGSAPAIRMGKKYMSVFLM
jgi:MORN repeat variant